MLFGSETRESGGIPEPPRDCKMALFPHDSHCPEASGWEGVAAVAPSSQETGLSRIPFPPRWGGGKRYDRSPGIADSAA